MALSSTPDAKHTKRIVDTLSLQKTLSNPALKLTVFTPRDSALDALAARMRTSAAALTGNKGLMQQVGARCRQLRSRARRASPGRRMRLRFDLSLSAQLPLPVSSQLDC